MIPNPAYKGLWSPRQIPNPNFFEDLHPAYFHPIAGVGIEIWTMNDGIMFDNIMLTTDKAVADAYADDTFAVKFAEEKRLAREEDAAAATADDSFVARAMALLDDAITSLKNPVVAGTAALALLIPLVVCFLMPGKKAAAPLPAAAVVPADATPEATTRAAPVEAAPKTTASPKVLKKK
jgi:hypothetical protein